MNRVLLAVACLTTAAASALAAASVASADAATTQRARLTVSPGIAQNGAAVASADRASVLGRAVFGPARRGRLVLVQRRIGREPWRIVARTHEDARGRVRFVREDKRRRTPWAYRVVAPRLRGLPRVVSNNATGRAWKLRFDEPFGGTSLNEANWGYRDLGILRGSRMHAESSRSAVQVGGGALTLQVRKNPDRAPDADNKPYFLNGHIGTQDKFSFTYGYAAARIRFQEGRGQHGAFWLQPQSRVSTYGPSTDTGTEIDVAEFFGKGFRDGSVASYLHTRPTPTTLLTYGGLLPASLRALRGRGDTWWTRYHVFSVRWTPTSYVFRIDGVEIAKMRESVSPRPEYLLLSMLTSDWELLHLDSADLPSSMKVDWVRVWQ